MGLGYAFDPTFYGDGIEDEWEGENENYYDSADDPELEMELHKEAEVFERIEAQRQARIATGIEHACAGCGCSESQACDGGCVWATETLCSRCASPGRAMVV